MLFVRWLHYKCLKRTQCHKNDRQVQLASLFRPRSCCLIQSSPVELHGIATCLHECNASSTDCTLQILRKSYCGWNNGNFCLFFLQNDWDHDNFVNYEVSVTFNRLVSSSWITCVYLSEVMHSCHVNMLIQYYFPGTLRPPEKWQKIIFCTVGS